MSKQKKRGKRSQISSESNLDIPSQIFQNRSLSVLESLVKYLKEEKNLTYSEIARLLNRDDRTIWTVYARVKKKQ